MKPNNLQKNSKKSTVFKILTTLFIFLAIFPQNSSQQEIVTKSNTIEAHCILSYDPQGRYNCYLFNIRTNSPTDVLEIVGEHMLNHTDDDVYGVIHRNSFIHTFNGEVLRKFANLRSIDLFGAQLQSINLNAFSVCGQLERLNIGASSQLLELPSLMLSNCPSFKVLWATFSRFTAIPSDFFGNTRSIEEINISNGRLTSFPDNLLRNMPNLRVFNVRNNQLTQLNPTNFFSALNLEEIDLFGNRFSDPQAIINLLNGHFGLKRIILSHNPFIMFNFNFFTQFQNLEELAVGGSFNMTEIEWNFLPSSLQTLRVYEINEEIPENAFVGVPNLTYLDISGLGITTLHQDTFSALTNLDRLDIMGTCITTFHPQLFRSQGKLRALHLSFNQIEELPEGVFAPLGNLGYNESVHGLFMIQNRLRRLSANSFGQHPHLRFIYFNHNQINEIQGGLFSRFNPRPALIDFQANVCVSWGFFDEENLDENPLLEECFNNFDGIPTTTPGGCGNNFKEFEIFAIILIGLVKVLMNFMK